MSARREDRIEEPQVGRLIVDGQHGHRDVHQSAPSVEERLDLAGQRSHTDRLLEYPSKPASDARSRSSAIAKAVTATTGTSASKTALSQPAQRLGSVDAGELEVHQHQIRRILLGDAQTLLPGLGLDDVVAGELEDVANQLEVQRIVLDDEDPARRHDDSESWSGCQAPTLRSASTSSSRRTGLSRYASAPRARPRDRSSTTEAMTTGMPAVAGVRLELGQYLPAVEPWQPDVEHHGGRQHPADQLESLDAVAGPQHPGR